MWLISWQKAIDSGPLLPKFHEYDPHNLKLDSELIHNYILAICFVCCSLNVLVWRFSMLFITLCCYIDAYEQIIRY